MTNMIHKSVDAKHSRRHRYINAIEPFRKRYNCTAAQVFGIVQGIEGQNSKLQRELEMMRDELKDTRANLEEVKANIEKALLLSDEDLRKTLMDAVA